MHSTSTSLLIRLRQPDDREAWSRFVKLYTPLIYYWARQVGLATDPAADLVQEVMLVMVRKLPDFRYQSGRSFRGWLRTVTLNKYREQRRRAVLPITDLSDSHLADVAIDPADNLFWEQQYPQQLVAQALELIRSEFQPTTWAACQRYLLDGQSADLVAREFGLSVWTVYAAKSRVIKRLRDELAGLWD